MIASADHLPPELRDTYEMLMAAFPNGVSEESYAPLLSVLNEHMSIRGLARVLAACTGKTYEVVYNDILAIQSSVTPRELDPGKVEQSRQALLAHGYEEWLRKS